MIDQLLFTVLLKKEGFQSKVWFGGYDIETVREGLATQLYSW